MGGASSGGSHTRCAGQPWPLSRLTAMPSRVSSSSSEGAAAGSAGASTATFATGERSCTGSGSGGSTTGTYNASKASTGGVHDFFVSPPITPPRSSSVSTSTVAPVACHGPDTYAALNRTMFVVSYFR